MKNYMKNKTLVGVAAVIILIAGIAAGTWFYKYQEDRRKEAEAERARQLIIEAFKPLTQNMEESKAKANAPKEYITVDKDEIADFGTYTLKVVKSEVLDVLKGDGYNEDATPVNKFVKVTMEGENKNTKPDFVSLSGIMIKDKEGKTYNQVAGYTSYQATQEEVPAGYKGCISCQQNPGVKSWQYLVFDLPVTNTSDLKLVFDNAPDSKNYEIVIT